MALTPAQKRENRICRFEQSFRRHGIGANVQHVATIWQRLVRLRHADEFGMCRCVITGRRYPAEGSNLLDSGHFFSRSIRSLIFHEMNCHPQAVSENRFGTFHEKYAAWLRLNYSEAEWDELDRAAKETKQWTKRELAELKVEFLDGIKAELARIERGEASRYNFVYPVGD